MFRLFLLLICFQFSFVNNAFAQNVKLDLEFSNNIDVTKYNLFIDINVDNKFILGEAEIEGIIKNRDKQIRLDFNDNLIITNLLLNDIAVEFSQGSHSVIINSLELFSNKINLKISYEGKPRSFGSLGFVFGKVNKQSLVYTMNTPRYASSWFPCNDDPSDKAQFEIKIRNTKDNISVSNGSLVGKIDEENHSIYYWKTDYPIATYLIALYSAPYSTFSENYIYNQDQDTIKIEYYVMPEHLEKARIDFADHSDYLNFFSEMITSYPFPDEKYGVAEFLWNNGAMEHQTITGIGYIFVSGRKFFSSTYVHELAHSWWGNSVGIKSWDDIWLNEGFATYFEGLYLEHKFGKDALKSFMLSKFDENFSGKLYAPKNLFGSTVYDKGAWVLHMLRFELGDSLFFTSLRNYYDLYKYGNASVSDFMNVCEKFSGRELEQFFDQWIFTGEDQIKADYNWNTYTENGHFKTNLTISQIQDLYDEYEFGLEIKLLFEDGTEEHRIARIDKRTQTIQIRTDKIPVDIILDPNNWLLASFSLVQSGN